MTKKTTIEFVCDGCGLINYSDKTLKHYDVKWIGIQNKMEHLELDYCPECNKLFRDVIATPDFFKKKKV